MYRMQTKYGGASKDDFAAMFKEKAGYSHLLMSDEAYKAKTDQEYEEDVAHFRDTWIAWKAKGLTDMDEEEIEREAVKAAQNSRERKMRDEYSVVARKKQFDEVVDRASDWRDSHYINKDLFDALRRNRIPIIRTDSIGTTGVLNEVPDMEVRDLKYTDDSARYHLVLKK